VLIKTICLTDRYGSVPIDGIVSRNDLFDHVKIDTCLKPCLVYNYTTFLVRCSSSCACFMSVKAKTFSCPRIASIIVHSSFASASYAKKR